MTAPYLEFMARALVEAERARGRTRPNPLVGCVIARGRRLVAVGHHRRAGDDHAEVAALKRAGSRARGADVYCTLEPCSHVGRTRPCADALIEAGVRRVFVGTRDPNPLVFGRGLRRLRAAGIEVVVGILAPACRKLNEAFEFGMAHHRPFVEAKVAQSLDGRVATRTGESQWICHAGRRLGQHLRNTLDAVMVGIGTAQADDPQLTCRVRGGRDPVRVVLDTQARLSPRARVVRLCRTSSAPTYVCVGRHAPGARCRALARAGAEVVPCRVRRGGGLDLRAALEALYARDIVSVLAEGGPTLLGGLMDARLINRLHVCLAPRIIGGVAAPSSIGGAGVKVLARAARLTRVRLQVLGPEWIISGDVTHPS